MVDFGRRAADHYVTPAKTRFDIFDDDPASFLPFGVYLGHRQLRFGCFGLSIG
jgi:hypothetical protein